MLLLVDCLVGCVRFLLGVNYGLYMVVMLFYVDILFDIGVVVVVDGDEGFYVVIVWWICFGE